MVKECNQCLHENLCTPFEKQLDNDLCECGNFTRVDFRLDCSTDGIVKEGDWEEFSWNRYVENLLDYGEESEWDLFLLEEKL